MKRVLIVKPSSMGDILHAFPAVNAFLGAYPEAAADWVVAPQFAELLDYVPRVERRILFRRKELGGFFSFAPAFFTLLRELRKVRYDAVLDLQGLMRSAVVGRLARADLYCGSGETREFFARLCYTKRIVIPEGISHAVDRNCALVRGIPGITDVSGEYLLPVVEKHRAAALELLKKHGFRTEAPFAVVCPGARWDTKQWPGSFFAEVIGRMEEERPELSFVLLGAPSEKELGAEVVRHLKRKENTVDLTGLTGIGSLIEVIRMASVMICNDSGPMHAAASAGTPVAALFGPTDPELTGPYCREKRVFQPDLDCIRCFRKSCDRGYCHTSVDPATVATGALELFDHRRKQP